MHQVVTKKLDVSCVDHTQYYPLTSPTSKDSAAGELINARSGSAAVDGLSVAQASSDPSSDIVFRGRTMKALKASANGLRRYDEIYQIVIPRQKVVNGVG